MLQKTGLVKILFITGVVAMVVGAIDPLEGSVIILAGSMGVALSAYLLKDRYWKTLLISFLMIVFGVFFLFYFSSFGGFGGSSTLSWWWAFLILPYPAGWLLALILLIVRAFKNRQKRHNQSIEQKF